MKKIVTIVGARPQFIKASAVSYALAQSGQIKEIIIHTGQHFDANMSSVFFDQLNIPEPKYLLNINGGLHGKMTGEMLAAIEERLIIESPDAVMVYGDTNSTLAGALAAAKLHIPVIHVEAGLRSFNMKMPEEINRILTDNLSTMLFCPTDDAVQNLKNEGMPARGEMVFQLGDVMLDAFNLFKDFSYRPVGFNAADEFLLVTIHRAENTDDKEKLSEIIEGINVLASRHRVIFPIHPRTKEKIIQYGLDVEVNVIDPVGYFEMLWLLTHSNLVVTDSGGLQKEAFFAGKPCVTVRDQTEWVELLDAGVNILASADAEDINTKVSMMLNKIIPNVGPLYGGGEASHLICNELSRWLCILS